MDEQRANRFWWTSLRKSVLVDCAVLHDDLEVLGGVGEGVAFAVSI